MNRIHSVHPEKSCNPVQRFPISITTIEVVATPSSEVIKKTSIAGCPIPPIQTQCNLKAQVMNEGDHAMAQLEKVQRTNKPCEFVLLSGLFFFAAMISVTTTAVVFAQQSAQTSGVNQKETNNMNQLSTAAATKAAADAIRPFSVNFPEAALADLRRRIAATKWPDREYVPDQTQGVQLATMQKLARYWEKDYDWRKAEAKLNALPQFITEIDGLDFHFIHVRSKHEDALPLIVTHGWPGSIIEQLKIIGPLTDPTAHGGSAEDAFHVVIPSMPGYGFSGKPTSTGWGPERMGR